MSSSWENLGLIIKRIQHRNLRLLEEKLAPLGVSMIQWNALRTIDRYPGVSMHRLAKLTFNSDQAFGTLAARLLRLDLIQRQPGSGRVTLHTLTPEGRRLLGAGQTLVQAALAKSFAALRAEECSTLIDLLSKLLDDDFPRDP